MGVSDEPRRGARRPRAQIAGAGRLAKQLGSLPVIADFSRRLDIAGIVDRACPMRDVGPLSHGQVIDALIANRRTDLKQIQAGLAVTADGAIPVFARAYDGNAAEISQVTDTMYALQALAASRSFLLVGDSKLISYANVTAMHDAQVTF